MTNSRSRSSRSRSLCLAVVLCAVSGAASLAHAERKRVVVLDLEGPKGQKFHDDLVRLIKKSHTVVPTGQWNGIAEQLEASTPSERNVRRVAKRLKVDAIVEGKIEKRRDEYILRLKVREGKTGEVVRGAIGTKAEGPRIDGRAERDLKDELVGALDEVASNQPGAEDDDERTARRASKDAEEDEEDRPKKRARRGDDDRAAKKRVARAEEDAEDEDDQAPKKSARKADDEDRPASPGKKTARAKGEDDEDALPPRKAKKTEDRAATKVADAEEDEDSLPPKKASKTDEEKARRFSKRPDDQRGSDRVGNAAEGDAAAEAGDGESGRKAEGTEVAANDEGGDESDDSTSVEASVEPGAKLDAATARSPGRRAADLVVGASFTMRRMSFRVRSGFDDKPPDYNGGLAPGAVVDATIYPLALYKRTWLLKDIGFNVMYDRVLKISTRDRATGMVVDTSETRAGGALVLRHAFGRTATAPVVMASFGYSQQKFLIAGDLGTPNVKYRMFQPGLGVRFPATANLIFGLDARTMLITNTGQIQQPMQYGAARMLGFEGAFAIDYLFAGGLFARAAFRYETIGYTFKGTGLQTTARDGIPSSQDIRGARDNYIGGLATMGYVY